MTEPCGLLQRAYDACLKTGRTQEEQRKALRAVFSEMVGTMHANNRENCETRIIDAFHESDYVGMSHDRINPRPSIVGLRDALPQVVLASVVANVGERMINDGDVEHDSEARHYIDVEILLMCNAISGESMPILHEASKCGVLFGAHHDVYSMEDDVKQFKSAYAHSFVSLTETHGGTMHPSMYTASLDQVITAHDYFVGKNDDEWEANEHVSEKWVDAMRNHAETREQKDRVEAFGAALEARLLAGDEVDYANAAIDVVSGELVRSVEAMLKDESPDESVEDDADDSDVKMITVKPDFKAVLDTMLPNATNGEVKDTDALLEQIRKGMIAMKETVELRKKVSAMPSAPAVTVTLDANGEIPDGDVEMIPAHTVFEIKRGKKAFEFEIPVFKWATPHPHVPVIDDHYIFRPMPLLNLLQALVGNEKAYLVGHTGTGKTTFIEQVVARMGWPMIRINFDSEITRMDLMGRDVLTNDSGVTTSKFVDGVLPTALNGPYVLCCDEVDRIRAEVSYVFNRMLEGNGLLITEDGGRFVSPHPYHRLVANANTVGQGDDFGLYQGARPQSQAFLDRFTRWLNIDYLKAKDEKKLLMDRVPGLPERFADAIMRYVKEHREAFINAEVLQPLSPRAVVGFGQTLANFLTLLPDENKASTEAFEVVILNRASPQDRAVLKGIHNRVWAVSTEPTTTEAE